MANRQDPQHLLVSAAIEWLIKSGSRRYYVPQNIVELWNVLTRPRQQNGCGLSIAQADREIALLESQFTLLPDHEQIHVEWRKLVVAHSVSGRQVHDARLVAAMQAHGVTHLLTLNTRDFARYLHIPAVHPQRLPAG